MTYILITVGFLDDRYHGLLDRGGPPEWPPSPFRLFQALVAGTGRRGELDSPMGQSLSVLQKLDPPIIITPKAKTGQAITRYVPNNDSDSDKFRKEPEKCRTAKPTIPTLFLLEPDQKPEVHYVWDISDNPDVPFDQIREAARSLTTLGWGIDMAFADARCATQDEIEALQGVRWYPKPGAWRDDGMLRTPTYNHDTQECTLCDLRHCHETAINRIQHGQPLRTVDKPKIFETVLYTSTERPVGRPVAVFKMIDANEDAYRYPHAKLIHIAGMVRHLAIERMKADPPNWIDNHDEWVNGFVRGKRTESVTNEHRQFSYVPLPSIGHEHADALIRNVMIIAPPGMERELAYVAERLNGEILEPEHHADFCESDSAPSMSGRIELQKFNPPSGKFIRECYLNASNVWQTVTPVILDGHNKKSKSDKPEAIARETEKLIRKALARAGIETPCDFTWQSYPYLMHCLSAHKYDRNGRHTGYHRPKHLDHLTAVHVRLTFTHLVSGPITIGAGRNCGLGLMAIPLHDR